MPRKAVATKDKLIAAGEHLFARTGIDGTLTRDIVARAGQANDSAVHYHFGSREGLLAAILDKHIQQMETERQAAMRHLTSTTRLASLTAAIVEPVADKLRSTDGRDFLRVIAQLSGQTPGGGASSAAPLKGTALAAQLSLLEQACRTRLPATVARERIASMITMLTALLAERARQIEARRRLPLEHEEYVANLVAMLAAALRAPSTTPATPVA